MGGGLAALTVAAAIGAWLLWWQLRRRAQRIEAGDESKPDKVHRLQRLAVAGLFAMTLAYLAGLGGFVALTTRADEIAHAWLVVALVAVITLFVALPMIGRTVRPALARVRDVPVKSRQRRRARLILLPVWLCVGAVFGGATAFAPDHGATRSAFFVGLYATVLLLVQLVLGPLLIVAVRARPLSAPMTERLARLARDMDVKVPKLRSFDGTEQKVANALQAGMLPGLRYVLVSDYLTDNASPDELDAVVAHEFGHLRGRHLLIKLGGVLLGWIFFAALYLAIGGYQGSSSVVLAFVPLLVGMFVGQLLVNGLIGVRLEKRADDAALTAVGAEPLIAALERLSQLNDTKRNTGRGWALLTQHPGLDDRIARLRDRADAAVPAGVA